jgi:hypothetical protein
MTPEQIEDLLIEWSIYNPQQQKVIEVEYQKRFGAKKDEDHWLDFLKEKLEIEDYWKKTGLL